MREHLGMFGIHFATHAGMCLNQAWHGARACHALTLV